MRRQPLNKFVLIVGGGSLLSAQAGFNSLVQIIEGQEYIAGGVKDSLEISNKLTREHYQKRRVGKGERKRNKSNFKKHF